MFIFIVEEIFVSLIWLWFHLVLGAHNCSLHFEDAREVGEEWWK